MHTNYLINLASSKPDLYEKSIEQFVIDLERTEALGAEYLVTHLGSASGQEPQWMIDRVSSALNMAMKLHPPKAMILLENTAGEKGDIGYELEQVQEVISDSKTLPASASATIPVMVLPPDMIFAPRRA